MEGAGRWWAKRQGLQHAFDARERRRSMHVAACGGCLLAATTAPAPAPTWGTMTSAHASKMLEVDPLCALFTSCGLDLGKAAPSQAAYWSR